MNLTLFVHLLQLLDDPETGLREGGRVGRLGAVALVELPDADHPDPPDQPRSNPREIVYEELRRGGGVEVPRKAVGPRIRDREMLRAFPPDRLFSVSDEEVTEPLVRQLEFVERRASRWTLEVPSAPRV